MLSQDSVIKSSTSPHPGDCEIIYVYPYNIDNRLSLPSFHNFLQDHHELRWCSTPHHHISTTMSSPHSDSAPKPGQVTSTHDEFRISQVDDTTVDLEKPVHEDRVTLTEADVSWMKEIYRGVHSMLTPNRTEGSVVRRTGTFSPF